MSLAVVNRPNTELTEEEKIAKRALKRRLKLQVRRRKLETRLRRARERLDSALEASTQAALEQLLAEEQDIALDYAGKISYSEEDSARAIIESIYHRLRARLDDGRCDKPDKEHQTEQARELLRNMTKGTQKLDMFENEAALRGYTRHKFIERAILVAHSLGKLIDDESVLHQRLLEQVLSVSCVCSIGCGPGCDLVGIAAFLRSMNRQLDGGVLLDWAMEQWVRIIEPLSQLLVEDELVGNVRTAFCDVRAQFGDPTNATASRMLLSDHAATKSSDSSVDLRSDEPWLLSDLVLCSYLLSETRNRWQPFFDDIVRRARPGTLFLLTDPTAWQLHMVAERYPSLEVCWLDSSMNQPALQSLEGRVGPAVLLAQKMRTESARSVCSGTSK